MKRRSIYFNPEQSEFLAAQGLGADKALKAFIRQHFPDFPPDGKAGNPKIAELRKKSLNKGIDN